MAAHAEIITEISKPPENVSPNDLGKIDFGKIDFGKIDTGKIDTGKIDFGKIDTGDRLVGGGLTAPPPSEQRLFPFVETNPGAQFTSPLRHDDHSGIDISASATMPQTGAGGAPFLAESEFDTGDREREEADGIFGYILITLIVLGTIGVLALLFTRHPIRIALPRWM
jgi:hypothetical protein